MKVSSEFSKYALLYTSHNIIQNRVVEKLLEKVTVKPQSIIDIGCGRGAICKGIDWEYKNFLGVDFALGMLQLHPKSSKIKTLYGDFDDDKLFKKLVNYDCDYIMSASALQWSKDLEKVFKNIKALDVPVALAIFTSNTFKTLNETANLNSVLHSTKKIKELQKKYFDADMEIINYELEFESTREMFRYIKQSGVSGSRKVLDYKQTKSLMNNYPLNYLEFEVAFIHSL